VHAGQPWWLALIALVSFVLGGPLGLRAAPVSADQALDAVTGWLQWTPAPMGRRTGTPARVSTVVDANGQPRFHVVDLEPSGFVVASADDEFETVLAFSHEDRFVAEPGRGYFDLLQRDVTARQRAVQAAVAAGAAPSPSRLHARAKWRALLAHSGRDAASLGGGSGISEFKATTIDDVRVAPLTTTRWSQSTIRVAGTDVPVYNYYTPPYAAGTATNYVAGCVATAWAQIMKFHRWPSAIGAQSTVITVDGTPQNRSLRGGDGQGGAYDWDNMVNRPDGTTTLTQRQAIGALLHDAGVGINMKYTSHSSSAFLGSTAIRNTFHYASAAYISGPATEFERAIRTNLDAGLPVGIAIFGTEDGQAVGHEPVVDGYGYNLNTPYCHLNMGWGGEEDAWYNLPNVDDGYVPFTSLDACTFNIMPQTTGEIVSGRLTGADGHALSGVPVIVNDGTTYRVVTNDQGIFAVKGIRSDSRVLVSPRSPTQVFQPSEMTVTTGLSRDYAAVGNRTADFTARARTASDTAYVPLITWGTPPNMRQGSMLSMQQLNATADVAGTFVYTPGLGTVLPVGTHTLSVTFTPTDRTQYTTATAQVSLTVVAGRSQLVNISTRAYCGTGNSVTAGGFVVTGSGTKRVLIRAVGPSLTAQGIGANEVLVDPTIEVYRVGTSQRLADNDDWNSDTTVGAEIARVGQTVGAQPLIASDTRSSALLLTTRAGIYTFLVKGKNDTAGIVLLEIYDAEPDSAASLFVNIAARGHSQTGNGVAIGGFVITGNAPKQVLLRAVGPTLTTQGIGTAEVLANPTIELYHNGVRIDRNDQWGEADGTAIRTTGARVGATPFDAADSASSAVIKTLTAGGYTFMAKGANDTAGIVLVEVYDAD
jgi:hypothetical protein